MSQLAESRCDKNHIIQTFLGAKFFDFFTVNDQGWLPINYNSPSASEVNYMRDDLLNMLTEDNTPWYTIDDQVRIDYWP